MKRETIDKLVAINGIFYRDFAPSFSNSRKYPWKGFERLSAVLPQPCARFLDVGCGDGRLGRYLLEREQITQYTGVDASSDLLAIGRKLGGGQFFERNLITPGFLHELGTFNAIACLATLHHIPSQANRARVLQELGDQLATDGRLIVTTFQFLDSERQRNKLVAWETVGIDAADVEPTDYLMSFAGAEQGVRHVNMISAEDMNTLIAQTDLTIIDQWRSDGKEQNLNLYTVLSKA